MNPTQEQIIAGAVAKIEQELAAVGPYKTSGTPNLDSLVLAEAAVSEAEMEQIVEQIEKSIEVDEGLKDIFDAAVGLIEGLLLRGKAFIIQSR